MSLLFAAGIFTQFELSLNKGMDLAAARTMAVSTLISMEVFYLFSMRYGYGSSITWRGMLGSRPVWISLAVVTLAQVLFIYAPFMQDIFDTQALGTKDLLAILVSGVLVLAVMEVEKRVRHVLQGSGETRCRT